MSAPCVKLGLGKLVFVLAPGGLEGGPYFSCRWMSAAALPSSVG
jgi:hypothetical protein